MREKQVTTNEIMAFLREHMVTKEYLHEHFPTKEYLHEHFPTKQYLHENFATKNELREFKDEIITTVDQFAKNQQKFDVELTALRSKYDRLADHLGLI